MVEIGQLKCQTTSCQQLPSWNCTSGHRRGLPCSSASFNQASIKYMPEKEDVAENWLSNSEAASHKLLPMWNNISDSDS